MNIGRNMKKIRKSIRFPKELEKKLINTEIKTNRNFSEVVIELCENEKNKEEEDNWSILWKRLTRTATEIISQINTAAIEVLARYFFVFAPEIPPELREKAEIDANRRQQGYMTTVFKHVFEGKGLIEKINKYRDEIEVKEKAKNENN